MISGIKNNITKSLAVILALTITASTSTMNASAGVVDNVTNTVSSAANTVKNKIKEFYENHPVLSKFLITTAALVGTHEIYHKIEKEWYLRDVTTAIDNLSDAEVKKAIDIQVNAYINRAPDIFEIEDEVIKKTHPRTLLITLMRLNQLFEKYDKFTEELIKYKREKNVESKKFTIRLTSYKMDGAEVFSAEQSTAIDLSGFAFGSKLFAPNYKYNLYKYKKSVENNYHSLRDTSQLIDGIIAHEFGHAMEILHITRKFNIVWFREDGDLFYVTHTKKFNYDNENDRIKREILKVANTKYKNTNKVISKYGETRSAEFFAEAFAHMECCNNPNPIGLATRDYIQNWFI